MAINHGGMDEEYFWLSLTHLSALVNGFLIGSEAGF